jgi:hypothetical protein
MDFSESNTSRWREVGGGSEMNDRIIRKSVSMADTLTELRFLHGMTCNAECVMPNG